MNVSTHSTPYVQHVTLSSEYGNEDDPITLPITHKDPEARIQCALDLPLNSPPLAAPLDIGQLDIINRFTFQDNLDMNACDRTIEFANTVSEVTQGYSKYYPARPFELIKDYDIIGDAQGANNAIAYVLALLDSGASDILTDPIQ